MQIQTRIKSLSTIGKFLNNFIDNSFENYPQLSSDLDLALKQSTRENPWFTESNLDFCLAYWAENLNETILHEWLNAYEIKNNDSKAVGLVLAGNIPMVGFHDVICTLLTGNIAKIKLSSKDKRLIPFFLNFWKEIDNSIEFEWVERLIDFDKVIATGSNNTARYFEYYFKDKPNIIRKNRTSIAVLNGEETREDLLELGKDIFTYFGLGCRNVTQLFIPKSYDRNKLFEAFLPFKDLINHHKYCNCYDYQKAIYLLNQDEIWDNNLMLLKRSNELFSPIATVYFEEYEADKEVLDYIKSNQENIQCVVSTADFITEKIPFGKAQKPDLNTYADGINTIDFLIQ